MIYTIQIAQMMNMSALKDVGDESTVGIDYVSEV